MYAGSIFGWLRYVERRVNTLRSASPVSLSPHAERCTEASRSALRELTDLVEPLVESAVSRTAVPGDSATDAMDAVLDTVQTGRQPTVDELPTPVSRRVESSTRFAVDGGYVFVLVDTATHAVNLPVVLERAIDDLNALLDSVTDVIKFLDADDTVTATRLTTRWKQVGGQVCDLLRICIRVLQRIRQQERTSSAIDAHVESTETIAEHSPRLNDD